LSPLAPNALSAILAASTWPLPSAPPRIILRDARPVRRIKPLSQPLKHSSDPFKVHRPWFSQPGRLPSSRCIRSAPPESMQQRTVGTRGAPDTALRLTGSNPCWRRLLSFPMSQNLDLSHPHVVDRSAFFKRWATRQIPDKSPVPKSEGPGAPSLGFGRSAGPGPPAVVEESASRPP
jgi:hypothetical protein